MPKYKQGDKVRVIDDLDIDEHYYMEGSGYGDDVVYSMVDLCGKVVTITSADERGYRIKEDWCHWTDEMFSGLAVQYQVGDRVLVKSTLDDLDHAPSMLELAGTEVTITAVGVTDVPGGEPGYSIAEDDEKWVWHDSDFAGEPIRRPVGASPFGRSVPQVTDSATSQPVHTTSTPATASELETNNRNEKESSKMKFDFKKMLKQYMPHTINDGSVALSISGDIAYRRKDGDYVFYDPESKSINNCMDLVLGSEALDKMVFVMPTKDVHVGDVVLNGGKYIYVTNITDIGIKGVSLESGRTATLVKEINTVMGYCPYAKVTSLLTMMSGRDGAGFNPMFLMLLGDSDSEDDLFTTIAMMTAMGGTTATATAAPAGGLFGGMGMNPLMLIALSGDDDGDSKSGGLMKMLLMSQMMGGGLFQAPAAAPAQTGWQAGEE